VLMVFSYGAVSGDERPLPGQARRVASMVSIVSATALALLLATIALNHNEESHSVLAQKEVIKTWHAQGGVAPPAPPASALAIDYLSFFTSDMFAEMSDSCCKTLFFPPGASARLPMDMDMDGEYVQRLRNFVGNRNTLLFNGADAKTIEFLNHYFGYKIKQVPVVSGYKRRQSLMVLGDPSTPTSIPEAYALEVRAGATYYGGLPDKLAPTKDMVAVDTLSLPGASIIIYNNWPRVPTGTPAFIIRYCQIEDPYEEGGKPMKVEVLDCPEAAQRGYDCSCGFINFVGWDWLGSNNNVWESSVVSADDLARSFGLADKKKAGPQQLRHLAPMAMSQTVFHQDCSGGDCHYD